MNMESLIKELKKKGYKLTVQRRLVLEALCASQKPLSAQEVYSYVTKKIPGIGFDTVYRNLTLLDEIGIVNRLHLKTKFNARFEIFSEKHRHYLVCLGCGKNIPIDYCPFKESNLKMAKREDFRITDHAFEVYGYCRKCDGKAR